MRDFKGMKRQRSRNRNAGNGGKPQHNANRAFESNGPDGVKIRGAAQHVFEKYQQLARDALTAGDRVLAESYQQHAEHYFRLLRAMQPNRPASDIIGRDAFVSGYDIDFEEEGEGAEAAPAEGEGGEDARAEGRPEWRPDPRYREDRPRDDRYQNDRFQNDRNRNFNRDDRQRDDRQRDDRPREDRQRDEGRFRDDRPRDDRPRGDRYRDDRPREDRQREDRPREDRNRDDRPRDERRYERQDRPERVEAAASDPLPVVEPQAAPLTAEAAGGSSPVLRSQDGGFSHAPAFLQPRAEPAAEAAPEDGEPRRPRRRRAPRSFDAAAGEGSSPVGASEDA
jgi:hypothetical protein